MKKNRKDLKLLVAASDADAGWLGTVLGKVGDGIGTDGCYDAADLCKALQMAADAASKPTTPGIPESVFKTLVTISDMGASEDSMRDWLRAEFKRHGLEVVGRGLRAGARFMLERNDGRHLYVLTHCAESVKEQNGLVSFSVYALKDPEILWHCFICRVWGIAFIRRTDEIKKAMRKDRLTDKDTAFVSFSPGARKNLFEHRVAELKSGPGWTNKI